MKSEGSSDRFFNQPAYNSSYIDSREYKVVYTWREDNPLVRGTKDFTTAYQVIAGTGNGQEFDFAGEILSNAVALDVTHPEQNRYIKDGSIAPETFFDFYYSENADATAEDNDDNDWKVFNANVPLVPNQKTSSMRASIKAGQANRLIDGETYKIRMTILRNDAQTVWSIVNTYDIDITKVMPTDLPKAFSVKSNQLAGGAWTFYVRPYAEVDFAAAEAAGTDADQNGNGADATNPWTITWGEYGVTANPNNFAAIFDAQTYKDKDDVEQPTDLHFYRWAMDTRMYNFEGIFNGLYIDEIDETTGKPTGNKTIDQNYYFVFDKSGSFAGATYDIKNGATEAKADNDNKAGDAIAVFDPEYDLSKVNQGSADADLTHEKGAYTLPLIHWSNIGQTRDVKAGYIYRDISATLNADGTAFLKPNAEKAGKTGLAITNDDFEIEAVPVKLGVNRDGAQVKATYKCALFDAAVKFTSDATENKFEYNQDIAVLASQGKFALTSELWQPGHAKQAYFNTQFNPAWTTTDASTLAYWITAPFCWVDIASLKFVATAPAGYVYTDYYDEPYFITGDGAKYDPEVNTFQEIATIGMKRNARTEGLPDFKSDVEGKFTFDIYDVWFHKKTVEVKVKITKPTNITGARQAR